MRPLLSHTKSVVIEVRSRRPKIHLRWGVAKVAVTITPTGEKFDLPPSVQRDFKTAVETAAERLAVAVRGMIIQDLGEIAKGGEADSASSDKTYPYNVVDREHEGFVVRIEAEVTCRLLEVPQGLFVGALRALRGLPADLKLRSFKRR